MRNQIYKALAVQYLICCLFLITLGVLISDTFFSGLVGCLAALLPASYISIRMARKNEEHSAQKWLTYVYKAQIGKWFMTIMIFTLILNSEYTWNFAILFTGFCLIHITSCVVPLMIKGD